MSIEDKIRALLEAAEQPTSAQLAYPGATTPQDPAPYMGVGYEALEFDRPGVVTDGIQQAQFPGQTAQDPAPYAGSQAQEIDPGQASALVAQAALPAPAVAGGDAPTLGAEFMELDPYDISSHVEQVAKENYPIASGADDVQPVQDPAASQEEDEYSKDIKQAAAPAPGIAESTIVEAYSVRKPRKVSAKAEGHVVVIDKKTAADVEKKLGLPKGSLSPASGAKYSETAVVKGADNKLHTVYADGTKARIRPYGHDDANSTELLKEHLNEDAVAAASEEPQAQPAQQDQQPDPQEQQDEILQQAVAAVQSGNKVEDVAKATGLDVKAIQDAIDAAKPTTSPSAPATTAPVSESVSLDLHSQQASDDVSVRRDAIRNPSADYHHIHAALNDADAHVRKLAIQHGNVEQSHIDKALNDSDSEVRKLAAERNGSQVSEGAFKDDVESLLAEETLSEEFKAKAGSLFEAAVIARVNDETARLEEAFESKLETEIQTLQEQYVQAVESFTEKQSTRLTGYINYLGEQWIKQNKVAVQSGIKSELTEGFMSGLQKLFAEHYINAPQEKLDLVEEQKSEIAKLQESIVAMQSEVAQLNESNQSLQRDAVIARLSEGLTDTEVAKLHALCEGISFESEDLFESKVDMVKTNFFKRKSTKSPEQLLESHVQVNQPQIDEQQTAVVAPHMAAYVKALDRFKSH